MSFLERSAKHFLAIKAAHYLKEELEKAGLDNLKVLADAGKSIVKIYLEGCSPEEQKRHRRDGNTLLQLGVTPDMVLTELAGQIEELSSIMKKRKDYKRSEISKLKAFLEEEKAKK